MIPPTNPRYFIDYLSFIISLYTRSKATFVLQTFFPLTPITTCIMHCPVLNNSFDSFWFSMVLVDHGFINCLASESFVVSFSQETENLMEVLQFLSNR